MRRFSLLAQIVAVISRRTPAFQPAPGQPQTFNGSIHALLDLHTNDTSLYQNSSADRP
jgi:hypothetical protein